MSETLEATSPPVAQEATTDLRAADAAGEAGVRVIEKRPSVWAMVHEAWTERRMGPKLGARYIAKYIRGARLGTVWLPIRAFVDTVGHALLFGGVLKVAIPGHVPYYIFLMSGMMGWRLFERSMRYTARSFQTYRKQMKNFRFPLLLVPVAGMALPLVEVVLYAVIFLGTVAYFVITDGRVYVQGPPGLLLVIPGLLLTLALTFAVGVWLSVLNAKAKDTRFILRFVVAPMTYVTPVVYPVSQLPHKARFIGTYNPMTAPIEMMRSGLVGTGEVKFVSLMSSLVFLAVVLTTGLWYFSREAARSIDAYGGFDDDDDDDDD
jgi:homopolymeric O-antigen transport system permease protein